MKSPTSTTRNAGAELDALLNKGVMADQRANKAVVPPSTGLPTQTPAIPSPVSSALSPQPVKQQRLERLTVRFTAQEARLLEKARGLARSMGYKLSDTAVFRLALNALDFERISPQNLEAVLAADSRRR